MIERSATNIDFCVEIERRLETLLDEAGQEGYTVVSANEFDAMECEALDLIRTRGAALSQGPLKP